MTRQRFVLKNIFPFIFIFFYSILSALLLVAFYSVFLSNFADSQFTAPGAYYVYAPGYNFNPGPGKRSVETLQIDPPKVVGGADEKANNTNGTMGGNGNAFITSN